MKAIIFDVDGVIIKSDGMKKEVIKNVLQKYNLYDIPGVKEILSLGLNRKANLEMIYELTKFDKDAVLKDVNNEHAILENNPVKNEKVVNFIKNNANKYIICTNTALPIDGLNRVIEALDIGSLFKEFLAYENGSKAENIIYVLEKYNLDPKDVLFIDDNINHINKVKDTGVHTLHFVDYDIDIEKFILNMKSEL